MKQTEKQLSISKADATPSDKKLFIRVDNCPVILNFPRKAQESVMTEVKRMILVGHSSARV